MSLRLAVVAVAILCGQTAFCADVIKPVTVQKRVATADAVVVGTVTEIEGKTIEVEYIGWGPKAKRYVAKVKVKDDLLKMDGLKEVRVAFVGKEDQPTNGLHIPTPVLEKNDEVLLFLNMRADEDFYSMPGWYGAVGKNQTFIYRATIYETDHLDEAIKEAKEACKIAADLPKYLKSKDDGERMTAAWMQFSRYRTSPLLRNGEKLVEKEIPAKETQTILDGLLVLAEKNATDFHSVANMIRPTAADGFERMDGQDYVEAVKVWMKSAPKEYRIKRYEVETAKR